MERAMAVPIRYLKAICPRITNIKGWKELSVDQQFELLEIKLDLEHRIAIDEARIENFRKRDEQRR